MSVASTLSLPCLCLRDETSSVPICPSAPVTRILSPGGSVMILRKAGDTWSLMCDKAGLLSQC